MEEPIMSDKSFELVVKQTVLRNTVRDIFAAAPILGRFDPAGPRLQSTETRVLDAIEAYLAEQDRLG